MALVLHHCQARESRPGRHELCPPHLFRRREHEGSKQQRHRFSAGRAASFWARCKAENRVPSFPSHQELQTSKSRTGNHGRGPAERGVQCVAGEEGRERGLRPRCSGAHAVPTPSLLGPRAPVRPPASEWAAPHPGASAAAGPTDSVSGKAVAGQSSGPGQGGNREAGHGVHVRAPVGRLREPSVGLHRLQVNSPPATLGHTSPRQRWIAHFLRSKHPGRSGEGKADIRSRAPRGLGGTGEEQRTHEVCRDSRTAGAVTRVQSAALSARTFRHEPRLLGLLSRPARSQPLLAPHQHPARDSCCLPGDPIRPLKDLPSVPRPQEWRGLAGEAPLIWPKPVSYFTVFVVYSACLIVERRTATEDAPPSHPKVALLRLQLCLSQARRRSSCLRLGCSSLRRLLGRARATSAPFRPCSLPENLWVCPAWEGACPLGHSWSLALWLLPGTGPVPAGPRATLSSRTPCHSLCSQRSVWPPHR